MPRPRTDPLLRFHVKTDKDGPCGCWLWTGSVNGGGYAQMRIGTTVVIVRRWIYETLVSPIPPGHVLYARKECPRRCVNPGHMTVRDPEYHRQHFRYLAR